MQSGATSLSSSALCAVYSAQRKARYITRRMMIMHERTEPSRVISNRRYVCNALHLAQRGPTTCQPFVHMLGAVSCRVYCELHARSSLAPAPPPQVQQRARGYTAAVLMRPMSHSHAGEESWWSLLHASRCTLLHHGIRFAVLRNNGRGALNQSHSEWRSGVIVILRSHAQR